MADLRKCTFIRIILMSFTFPMEQWPFKQDNFYRLSNRSAHLLQQFSLNFSANSTSVRNIRGKLLLNRSWTVFFLAQIITIATLRSNTVSPSFSFPCLSLKNECGEPKFNFSVPISTLWPSSWTLTTTTTSLISSKRLFSLIYKVKFLELSFPKNS